MNITNKINFQSVDSDLLAAGIMYFEDYIATMHKNLKESGFDSFDAFSVIEITTTTLLQDKNLNAIESSIRESIPKSKQLDNILAVVGEFHKILHDSNGSATITILEQKGDYDWEDVALIIMFLNHLAVNFLRILENEKSKLTAGEIDQTKFTQLLALIFDSAFEKTLAELKN